MVEVAGLWGWDGEGREREEGSGWMRREMLLAGFWGMIVAVGRRIELRFLKVGKGRSRGEGRCMIQLSMALGGCFLEYVALGRCARRLS